MIWFAGMLQNTCCNKINENKTKKKPLSCVWCLLHNFAHLLTLCHMHQTVCFTANTQMTNFSFQVLVHRRSLCSIFLDFTSIFFLECLGTHLFGRALTRSQKPFFLPMDYFFGMRSWRNAGYHHLGSQKLRDC